MKCGEGVIFFGETGCIFSITLSLCFPLCLCWLFHNGLGFFSCVCTLFFVYSFLQYSLIFVFQISFHHLFSLNNAFMCNLHNTVSVFMLLLKRNIPLAPHYLSSDVCLCLFVPFSFLFAHRFSKQEQSYSGENWV